MKCFDLVRWVFSKARRNDFEFFCVILWGIWNDRNNLVHSQKSKSAALVLDHALFLLQEFQTFLSSVSSQFPKPLSSGMVGRIPPPHGSLKLNCDAAVRVLSNSVYLGPAGPLICDIKALCKDVGVFSCQAISRSRNVMAHMLTSFALSSMKNHVWLDIRPSFLASVS
ncbi:hypothetical protein ACOSQ4_009703 [Xanthoceras sorbifolium]